MLNSNTKIKVIKVVDAITPEIVTLIIIAKKYPKTLFIIAIIADHNNVYFKSFVNCIAVAPGPIIKATTKIEPTALNAVTAVSETNCH